MDAPAPQVQNEFPLLDKLAESTEMIDGTCGKVILIASLDCMIYIISIKGKCTYNDDLFLS